MKKTKNEGSCLFMLCVFVIRFFKLTNIDISFGQKKTQYQSAHHALPHRINNLITIWSMLLH